MDRCGGILKTLALVATTMALAAGSLLAQERGDRDARRDRMERIEREVRAAREAQVRALRLAAGRRAVLGVLLDDEGTEDGARIAEVLPGSPAEEAGLREGDVVTSVDGTSLTEPLPDSRMEDRLDPVEPLAPQRLVRLTRHLEPGEPVEVEYRRDGESRSTTVTPEAARGGAYAFWDGGGEGFGGAYRFRLPEGRIGAFRPRGTGPRVYGFREDAPGRIGRCPGRAGGWTMLHDGCVAGLRLVPLNEGLGEYFDADRGVLVADVDSDSELGLTPGDVIRAIDGRNVTSPRDVTRILRSYRSGEEVSFRTLRKGSEVTVRGTME